MAQKPGTPKPDKEQQHPDEDEFEDLEAPAESQEEVAGGCSEYTCSNGTECFNTKVPD